MNHLKRGGQKIARMDVHIIHIYMAKLLKIIFCIK